MTKYVVRKLDFGYLRKIKKKILYLKNFNRVIRFKNRASLKLKKEYKIFINKVSQYKNVKNVYKFSLSDILKPYKMFKLKLGFSKKIINIFNVKIKKVKFQKKYIIYNFLKKRIIKNIKRKILKFIKKKKKLVRKYLRKKKKYIENIHNSRFRSKYIKLKILRKISRKIQRKFFKYKGKITKNELYAFISNKKNAISVPKKKYIPYKKEKKSKIDYILAYNNMKNKIKPKKKKRARVIRKEYVFKKLTKKGKKKQIKKINKIKNLILRIKKETLINIKNKNKFKIVTKKNKLYELFKIMIKVNYKKIKKEKTYKYKYNNFAYLTIRVRKLKIKYYISKLYIVTSKYLKNIINIRKYNLNNFFNIGINNKNRYSNIANWSNCIKFFFNFIFFYFFKFCKIKGISKKKKVKKLKFKNNYNCLLLDRPFKGSKINHIFETQNSFFFFRFIRLSKKILDIFLPIKKIYIKENDVNLVVNKNIIYYNLMLKNISLNSNYFKFKNILTCNTSIVNKLIFAMLYQVVNKKENIIKNF